MRKLLRSKMRHQAENEMKLARKQASKAKNKNKKPIEYRTIDVFRYLWKEHLKKLSKSVAIHDRRKPTKKYAR